MIGVGQNYFKKGTKMITIKVYTNAGTNASEVGDRYGYYEGVRWHSSCDRVDSDGLGRVQLDCDCEEIAQFVICELEEDNDVESYARD